MVGIEPLGRFRPGLEAFLAGVPEQFGELAELSRPREWTQIISGRTGLIETVVVGDQGPDADVPTVRGREEDDGRSRLA